MTANTEKPPSKRNPFFDVVKCILIVWVVWGHLQSTGVVEPSGAFFERLIRRVKVANMPAFFMISGYFAVSTFHSGDWGKILARVTSFAWPRATFAAIFVLLEILLCDVFVQQQSIPSLFLFLYHGRWFLLTLGTLYLFSAIVYRVGKTDVRRWLLFGIAYVCLLFCPARVRPLLFFAAGAQLVHMYPYFVLGLMVMRKRAWWKKSYVVLCCALFFMTIILQEELCTRIVLSTWKAPVDWRHLFLHGHWFIRMMLRTSLGVTGTITLLALVDKLIERVPILTRLAPFGTTTMGVYIVHERPFEILAAAGLSSIPFPHWTRFPLAILWFLVCHAFICAIRRHPALNTLFFGNEKSIAAFYRRVFFSPIGVLSDLVKSKCHGLSDK